LGKPSEGGFQVRQKGTADNASSLNRKAFMESFNKIAPHQKIWRIHAHTRKKPDNEFEEDVQASHVDAENRKGDV
jgi:hypothetical protein